MIMTLSQVTFVPQRGDGGTEVRLRCLARGEAVEAETGAEADITIDVAEETTTSTTTTTTTTTMTASDEEEEEKDAVDIYEYLEQQVRKF